MAVKAIDRKMPTGLEPRTEVMKERHSQSYAPSVNRLGVPTPIGDLSY